MALLEGIRCKLAGCCTADADDADDDTVDAEAESVEEAATDATFDGDDEVAATAAPIALIEG
jgi:hypothetical protein